MASTDDGNAPAGTAAGPGGVPALVFEQAKAAAASEHDASDDTPAERKHMGHDVPTATAPVSSSSSSEPPPAMDNVADVPHPPPAYGDHMGSMQNEQDGFKTNADVADDGRVNIRISQRDRKLSAMFAPALKRQQSISEHEAAPPPPYIPPSLGGDGRDLPPPPMNVVIHVVGSRGDVQPFVALGKVLVSTYGHRVRLATHPVFENFVTENGLEFFSIGGDPAQLMAFMVKNPGLMPGFDSLRDGDVGRRRKEVAEYLKGCWRSCYESGNGLGPEATDDTVEDWASLQGGELDPSNKPFVADCIIANPPSFAHAHCAEKLGLPLHIMFTMPYSPTQAFPHPLANIQATNADPHLTNYVSYALIDMLTWQGLGDVINRFRQKSLGLDPISLVWAPGMLQRLKVPHTYCWSPALIPKPKDWGQNINISGFFFLNTASNYTPAPDLQAFLDAGPPPVYIGFGSIVLDDPNAMTKLIFEAVQITGQRVLLSKGWGGMGAEELGIPDGVFMLGNVPHDWLFKHVSCVVHHGGAGTTAAGITAGRPTVVVPFFGDQPFWGSMVARAGAGPDPIPHKQLTAENLASAIKLCLEPGSQERALQLADNISEEKGKDVGAQLFHQMLDVDKLRCTLAPEKVAVWRLRRTQVRLSALAACTLANEGLLDFNELKLLRHREYETDDGPWDPISGATTALVGTMSTMLMGIADMPVDTLKALKIHPDAKKKAPSGSADSDAKTKSSSESKRTLSHRNSMASDKSFSSGATTPVTSQPETPPSGFNVGESLDRLKTPPTTQTNPAKRSTSMSDALRGQLSEFRSRSQSGSRESRSRSGSQSEGPQFGIDNAINTGKGVNRILGAGFKSPMDFSMAVAKGFHNAPKLYGDDTVRQTDQVTDFRSGLKVASKEFGLGLYDGITGLVTQPVQGARKEGAAGFVKGVGKGIGGVVLKTSGAAFSIPGYTMKGIYKEMQTHFGSSVQNYIIAARTAQGFDDWGRSSEEQRSVIVQRWKELQKDLKKKKNPDELVVEILEEHRRKSRAWRQDLGSKIEQHRSRSRANTTGRFFGRSAEVPGHHDPESEMLAAEVRDAEREHTPHAQDTGVVDDAHLEEAVRRSMAQESPGPDSEEDAHLDRAIRASVQEMQLRSSHQTDEDADLRRAIEASVGEVRKARDKSIAQDDADADADDHDEELARALKLSLEEHKLRSSRGEHDAADSAEKVRDLEEQPTSSVRPAAPDPTVSVPSQTPLGDSGHVQGTTRAEFEAQHQQAGDGEKLQRERTEEEIVTEYVKKQSLLEEEHRRKMAANKE